MRTITTQDELVEMLFKKLDESQPEQEVNSSFLLRIGGLCLGLIYGQCQGIPPYLSDLLAMNSYPEPTGCGQKLVGFAQALADEGCFNPTRAWSVTRLIELMLAALDSDDLQVLDDEVTGHRYVVSSQTFAAHSDLEVRVRMTEAG
jgi:hypothetical protein